ncbi:MAG: NADH-quinone oxidoreductase subunit J [Anaerolineales bacterium]|nr:NADH-quinone oxidoreductase subunit J [Anaerolineales bacterium]
MGSFLVFAILAVIAIFSAIMMFINHNAVYSALWLVLNFATIGVFYLILNAPFIAMVQITVYAGAIMVLFLFVIMLLGVEPLAGVRGSELWQRIAATFLGVVLVGVLTLVLFQGGAGTGSPSAAIDTSPAALGLRLFEGYVFPFEITGVLLLVAMIGVVVLNQRKKRGQNG